MLDQPPFSPLSPTATTAGAPVISVATLARQVRQCLETSFPLLWVSGEISNLTRAASGHLYFTLKDEAAQVRCVMFRQRAQSLPWRLENGQQVEARVLVGLYEPRGDFQLNVENLRRGGQGRLFEAFLRLKEQLAAEGLFDDARKRPLPDYPRRIGLITSPQAAALRDMLVTLRRRAPHVPVVLYPTPVQGEGSAEKIAAAIDAASTRGDCDVLIVARGGGSIEDLWAFNEAPVARALARATLPVVSGVGHETDTTIADFAADLRAPTPTAAAELVTAGWLSARHETQQLAQRLHQAPRQKLENLSQGLDLLAHRLIHPAQRLAHLRQHLALLQSRLDAGARRQLDSTRHRHQTLAARLHRQRPAPAQQGHRLALIKERLSFALQKQLAHQRGQLQRLETGLEALNPLATLARGYVIVRSDDGRLRTQAQQLRPGDALALQFADGQVSAEVTRADNDLLTHTPQTGRKPTR